MQVTTTSNTVNVSLACGVVVHDDRLALQAVLQAYQQLGGLAVCTGLALLHAGGGSHIVLAQQPKDRVWEFRHVLKVASQVIDQVPVSSLADCAGEP